MVGNLFVRCFYNNTYSSKSGLDLQLTIVFNKTSNTIMDTMEERQLKIKE